MLAVEVFVDMPKQHCSPGLSEVDRCQGVRPVFVEQILQQTDHKVGRTGQFRLRRSQSIGKNSDSAAEAMRLDRASRCSV